MPNILLTQKCVRSCPYCFAKKHMSESAPDDILTWENLIYIADLFETSNDKAISLLGGEPFLNPNIIDYLLYLFERGFYVNVFTSGILKDKVFYDAQKYLSHIDNKMISFICNVNHPSKSSYFENELVNRFLHTFGHIVTLSYNIYKIDFEIDFIFDYILKYGLKKHLRLGLAHPIPGEKNVYINPNDLFKMADRLASYIPTFDKLNIEAGLDCGFPLCVFSNDTIAKLFFINKDKLTFSCGPAIDIGPDMNVWSCFPLSNYNKKSLYEFNSVKDIYDYYNVIHMKIRKENKGLFDKCDDCNYFAKGICSGGCLAHSLNKFLTEAKIREKELYPDE